MNKRIVCDSFNYIVHNYFTINAWSFWWCHLNEMIKLVDQFKRIDWKSAAKLNIFLNHLMFSLVDYSVTNSGNPTHQNKLQQYKLPCSLSRKRGWEILGTNQFVLMSISINFLFNKIIFSIKIIKLMKTSFENK